MKVPLIATDFIDGNQDQYISIWYNGKHELVRPPIKPYFLSSEILEVDWSKREGKDIVYNIPEMEEGIIGKRLSTGEQEKFYKYKVHHTGFVKKVNVALEKTKKSSGIVINDSLKSVLLENHVLFPWRILIDCPDFYTEFPNTKPLDVGVFDFETYTKNHVWSNPKRDPILCYSLNDKFYMIEDNHPKADEELCYKFIEYAKRYDILSGQNIKDFDLPYLFGRCKVHGIDMSDLSRTGRAPIVDDKGRLKIDGRIIYDTFFDGIIKDQTLYGIKLIKGAGGQKAVLKKWGYEPKELTMEEIGNTYKLINTEKLKEYVESDREGAQTLFKHYFFTTQQVAEYLKTPLNFILDYTSIFIPSIVQGKDMLMSRTFSDGTNRQRHPELNWGKGTYQAAVTLIIAECLACKKVFLYGTGINRCPRCRSLIRRERDARKQIIKEGGLYSKVNKIDFSGYYDTIQMNFNLSPSTTRIIGYIDYPTDEFEFAPPTTCEHKDNKMILYVPDNKIGKTVVIEIDINKKSYTVDTLKEIKQLRLKIKTEMKKKKKGTIEYEHLYSQQNALKIVNKTFSGCNANAGMRYGDIAVSIAIVGIARTGIIFVVNYLRERYGVESVIEVDTDGAYTSVDIDTEDLNKELSKFITKTYGIENILTLDEDNYREGFFALRKVYILRDTNGELIIKGNAFKSSAKPIIFDKVLKEAAELKLDGKGDEFKGIRFDRFSLLDFTKAKTMNMPPSQYKKPDSSDIYDVARQGELYGIPMGAGNRYTYIETKEFDYAHKKKPYTSTHKLLQSVKDRDEINFGHYRLMLETMLDTFGILKRNQKDLSRWLK